MAAGIIFDRIFDSDPIFYSYEPLNSRSGVGFTLAARNLYTRDINKDGLDELIFAGFETQFNTPATYTNTKVAIYGWQDGLFRNLTQQWLPNGADSVEGVGDVAFGDFNGDGYEDIFLSAETDMNHPVNAYQLKNTGKFFEKSSLGIAVWQHGIAVADINKDGFDDIFASGFDIPIIYMGNKLGLSSKVLGKGLGWPGNGSDIELADFLGDGTVTAITVDSYINGINDVGLYKFKADFNLQLLSLLPPSRMGKDGHDVRVVAFDFSDDGLKDAIVFTRAGGSGTTWPELSEIQFLENLGSGIFKDVTDTRLIGYERNSNISYSAHFIDINFDGLVDIFSSAATFGSPHQSTRILLAQQNGTYIDYGRDQFSSFFGRGEMAGLVKGPNNQFHLVIESQQYGTGKASVKSVGISFPERNQSETLTGTNAANEIYGLGGNDKLIGKGGNDSLDGGSGIDAAKYQGKRSDYLLTLEKGNARVLDGVSTRDGIDTLTKIERLQFTDINVALDVGPNENAGSVYMLYKAAFNRAPDNGGMGYWLAQKDSGKDIVTSLAQGFVASKEFTDKYGTNPSNASYVDKLYQNVLGRAGESGGVAYWNQELDAGRMSKAAVLVQFATLAEGASLVAPLIANGIQYQEWVG